MKDPQAKPVPYPDRGPRQFAFFWAALYTLPSCLDFFFKTDIAFKEMAFRKAFSSCLAYLICSTCVWPLRQVQARSGIPLSSICASLFFITMGSMFTWGFWKMSTLPQGRTGAGPSGNTEFYSVLNIWILPSFMALAALTAIFVGIRCAITAIRRIRELRGQIPSR